MPGSFVATPRLCTGCAVGPKHRQLDPRKAGMEASAPHDGADVELLPVLEHGTAVLDANGFCNALDSAGLDFLRASTNQRSSPRRAARVRLSTERSVERQQTMKYESQHDRREHVSPHDAVDPKWNVTRIAPGYPRAMTVARRLDRDLSARVPSSHHQHRTLRELRRISVFARVQLNDRRIEIFGKRWNAWLLVVRHRDDDVLGLDRESVAGDEKSTSALRQPSDGDARSNRELEVFRVRLEIVGHRVFCRERTSTRRGTAFRRARRSAPA